MPYLHLDKLKSFSESFNIKKEDVDRLGFFDVTVDLDSRLYIDAKLLSDNVCPGFVNAQSILKKSFLDLIIILTASKEEGDMYWKEADKRLTFSEIHGTCLGYSNTGTDGNAIGKVLRHIVLSRIWSLIQEGKKNPEIFELIPVFTDNFGCDRTSDLIAFMIREPIFEYNEYIINELHLESFPKVEYMGHNVLMHPSKKDQPILVLPKTILSDLPVCFDFSDIENVVAHNEIARKNLETYIEFDQEYSKDQIYDFILNKNGFYEALISAYSDKKGHCYDFNKDRLLVIKFREILSQVLKTQGNIFIDSDFNQCTDVVLVARKCVEIFKHIIEDCGFRKTTKYFDESGFQALFFASSYVFCKENNVSFFSEVKSGGGPVDFVLSENGKVVSIEIKKSSHRKYKEGVSKQLPAYMKGNDSIFGFYLFINVDGKSTSKVQEVYKKRNNLPNELRQKIEIQVVDAYDVPSPSKM